MTWEAGILVVIVLVIAMVLIGESYDDD